MFFETPDALKYDQSPTQRGSSYTYSDLAIQTALMMRLLTPLPLRQTEGFLTSLLAFPPAGTRKLNRTETAKPLP